jgi:hypothetical protein
MRAASVCVFTNLCFEMSTKKTIVVVGATGIQGLSVVKAFLSLPDWHIRGTTRNVSSPAASDLTTQGVEMVQVELADPASLDRAFAGADTIFLNTDFWAPYAKALKGGESRESSSKIAFDAEVRHAKNAIEAAAKRPPLRRFVYSALGPMNKASGGKYSHSGHWETKAAMVDYIEKEMPELAKKTQFVYPTAYHTNAFLLPKQYPHFGEDRILLLPGFANATIPVIDTDITFGLLVRSLVVGEDAGVKLFAYDCNVSADDMLQAWKQRTGLDARFVQVPLERMQEITGLPYEVLDGAGFLSEYHYMAGVEGKIIEPKDLKNPVATKSLLEMLETIDMAKLIGSVHNAR